MRPPPIRIAPEASYESVSAGGLPPGHGYLLLQLDTNIPLAEVSFAGGQLGPISEAGRSTRLLIVQAGSYAWRDLLAIQADGTRKKFRLRRRRYHRPEELDFDVVAGTINYSGELFIRQRWPYLHFRNRNHSAMAIRKVLESHPRLIEEFGIRYAGTGSDEFLVFYLKERENRAPDVEDMTD